MSDTDVWMPLYIGDYLADTQRLSTEQHGAYLLLIMDYWRNGAPPADDAVLAQITRLDRAAWRRHKPALQGFFTEVGGKLAHKRIEEELSRAVRKSEALAARSTRAAKARWRGDASSTAQALLEDAFGDSSSMSSSTPQALLEQCQSQSQSQPPSQPEQGHGFSLPEIPPAPGSVPDPAPPAEKPFISLETNTGQMFHVGPAYVARLQSQFPAVQVEQQLRQMQAWLESNRRNRKTTQGMTRFIANWLSRTQDRAPRANAAPAQPPSAAPAYLADGEDL